MVTFINLMTTYKTVQKTAFKTKVHKWKKLIRIDSHMSSA